MKATFRPVDPQRFEYAMTIEMRLRDWLVIEAALTEMQRTKGLGVWTQLQQNIRTMILHAEKHFDLEDKDAEPCSPS